MIFVIPFSLFTYLPREEGKQMKKIIFLFFLLVTSVSFVIAEPLHIGNLTVYETDLVIDFGLEKNINLEQLIQVLDKMPQIKEVDMYSARLSRQETDFLFDRYPNIFFGWTVSFWEHTFRTDQTAFSTLHGSSPKPPHTEKDFEILRYCKNLKALDIGHNWVEDISFITKLPQLEVLILGRNQIKDITPLAEQKELVYLELFSNHIKDVTPLKELKKLRDLNLSNNPITDLSPLMEMYWLERLWLGKFMNYPKEQKKEILNSLTDTEFFWDWGPTAGTWREHPHYFELYDFFRTTIYKPFME
jgi:hypothetical protein